MILVLKKKHYVPIPPYLLIGVAHCTEISKTLKVSQKLSGGSNVLSKLTLFPVGIGGDFSP